MPSTPPPGGPTVRPDAEWRPLPSSAQGRKTPCRARPPAKRSSFKSAIATRMDFVIPGASPNLNSNPIRRPCHNTIKSSSAPPCVAQKYASRSPVICSVCSSAKPSHDAPSLGCSSTHYFFRSIMTLAAHGKLGMSFRDFTLRCRRPPPNCVFRRNSNRVSDFGRTGVRSISDSLPKQIGRASDE